MMKVHTQILQYFTILPFTPLSLVFDLAMEEKDGVGSKTLLTRYQDRFDGTIRSSWIQSLVHLYLLSCRVSRSNCGIAGQQDLPLDCSCGGVWHLPLKQLEFAYKRVNLINNMQSTLTALIDAASVLGVFMMGALSNSD